MDTRTNQLTQKLNTNEGFALYVHIHSAYYGFVVYDTSQQIIHRLTTSINHQSEQESEQLVNGAIDNDSLAAWIEEHIDTFNSPFGHIRVCISTSMFQLLNDERMATPANFTIMNKFEEGKVEILTDRIRDDLYVQFGLDKKLFGLLSSHFEKEHLHFGERGLLQLLSVESELIADGVYCQILEHDATVAVISKSRLVFFNKYQVKNREDLLYYILLCYQAHDLEQEKDVLYLSGLIEGESPMYELVYDYIRNIEWMKLPGEVDLPKEGTEEQKIHYFINLLSIR